MSVVSGPISIAQIHAFVDEQLNETYSDYIEEYLDGNPEKFDELQRYITINDRLHSAYDSVLSEEIPESILNCVYRETPSDYATKRLNQQFVEFDNTLLGDAKTGFSGHAHGVIARVQMLLNFEALSKHSGYVKWQSYCHTVVRGIYESLFRIKKIHPDTAAPDRISKYFRSAGRQFDKFKSSARSMKFVSYVGILLIGMLVGNILQGGLEGNYKESRQIGNLALKSHLIYTNEGRIAAQRGKDKKQEYLTWFSNRVGQSVDAIDLSETGFHLIGSMLLPSIAGYALIFVYENQSLEKVSLYVSGQQNASENPQLSCHKSQGTTSYCSWSADLLRYVIVADVPIAELKSLSLSLQ